METINVSFDELSAMAFEQRSSKPGLQSMTSGQISSGLDLTYASSTITTQQPSEGELDLLFEAMYDDYIGGQPLATARTSPVIIIRIDNGTKFKNQVLKEFFDTVGISHQMSSVRTPQQNGVVERRNRTLAEAARTMLIFSRAPLFLWAEAIATACFTQNHIGKLGAKGDIGFFIGYSADSCAYRVYDRRTKKIMETINVSFDELSAMAF
nr:putative ribonuclease H-like domain-containing protein [Tanacetum cinerariifolium]